MIRFIEIDNPITHNRVRIDFNDEDYNIGFFERFSDSEELKEFNKWRFVPNNSALEYQNSKSIEHSIIIDGEDVSILTLL